LVWTSYRGRRLDLCWPGCIDSFSIQGPSACILYSCCKTPLAPGRALAWGNMSRTLTWPRGTPGTCGNGLFGLIIMLVNFLPQSLTSCTIDSSTSCILGMSFAPDAVASSLQAGLNHLTPVMICWNSTSGKW